MSETRTVYTADQFEQLALVADTEVDAEALRQAAAQARAIERMRDELAAANRRHPGDDYARGWANCGAQMTLTLSRILREEGLR